MSNLQNTILTNANKYIIDALCDLLNTKVKAVVYGTKTFLVELSNGNFIEACSFHDAINQIECLVN